MSSRTLPAARPLITVSLVLLLAACTTTPGTSAAPASSAAAPSLAPESTPAAPSLAVESSEASATASAPASGEAAGVGAIEVADSDLGQILTDADGMTIYFFANDEEGMSTCEGDCLANWPPVPAETTPAAGDGVTAELGTFTRSDGTSQLTVNGYPAYYFAADEAAGDTTGQGVGGVWWVFAPDGQPIEQ